ncbi:hypothetical protein V5H98_12245 [Georgenia sp. M64]|uniref:hypothetical protein n=1 Tax=Georgenia sp. M64 TaxID=3120520 RepID=UPI0030E05085
MDTVPLSAEQVIGVFWARSRLLQHPALHARGRLVRRHLDVYLDTEAEQWLTTPERALVEAERQLDPAGAVARVTGPEALVAALPGFVDAEWLLPSVADAHAQLLVVDSLVRWLIASGTVDAGEMSCSVLEIETRLAQAAAGLDRRRALSRSDPPGRLPPGAARRRPR